MPVSIKKEENQEKYDTYLILYHELNNIGIMKIVMKFTYITTRYEHFLYSRIYGFWIQLSFFLYSYTVLFSDLLIVSLCHSSIMLSSCYLVICDSLLLRICYLNVVVITKQIIDGANQFGLT